MPSRDQHTIFVQSWDAIFFESKDWEGPADVTTALKFAGVLRAAKCRFGIIFSKNGISGQEEMKYAERELLKIKQDEITILSISEDELKELTSSLCFAIYMNENISIYPN